MSSYLNVEKVWSDDVMMEFEITTADGCSQFCVKVYSGHSEFEALIVDLDRFKREIYGGIYDIEFGKFGPEFANGAFQARLHFDPDGRGKLFITVHAESDWVPFKKTEVASRALLYLKSQPVLLDNFIDELRRIISGSNDKATFECVWCAVVCGKS
jgi:hypothetical protein